MANIVVVEQVSSPATILYETLLRDAGHGVTRAKLIHPPRAEDISERVRQADVVVLSTTSQVIPPEWRQSFYQELRTYGKPIVVADKNLYENPIKVGQGDIYINTVNKQHSVHRLLPEVVSSLVARKQISKTT